MAASLEAFVVAFARVQRQCTSDRFLFVLAVFSYSSVFAQDDLIAVPNRPTISTTAQPVQPGVLEIEWGVDARRFAPGHQRSDEIWRQ